MKLLITTIALLFTVTFNPGYAQTAQPEKVYSIIKVYKPYEWYTEQYGLWDGLVKKNKKKGENWENLYAAARMAKIMSPDTTNRNLWYATMEEIILKVEKAIPNSYEYYHLKSWHSNIWGSTPEEVKEIGSWAEKAYAIDPTKTEIYPDLMNLYMIKGDTVKMEELSKIWLKSGDISPNLLALTYNMLNSTAPNATLLTAGDNDTYPALILQYGKGIRKDVTIINIYCASGSTAYRQVQLNQAKIATTTSIDNELELAKYVVHNRGENPLYFAYANYVNQNPELSENLYNVGLALRYSEETYNNTSDIINNFENKYLLDHLTFNSFNEQFPEQVKRHNLSYLPGLFILYDHYITIQDTKKQADIKTLILQITANTPHEETAKSKFEKC